MAKNTGESQGKGREFCQSGKAGTLSVDIIVQHISGKFHCRSEGRKMCLSIEIKLEINCLSCTFLSILMSCSEARVLSPLRVTFCSRSSCWLVRGSLFIELGCPGDLGKGWRGDLGTFMISRPI